MKTSSWFSTERDVPAVENVYHHNTMCREGKKVAKNHHRHGTDNRPLCEECARLDAAGK
jgi:hypothetical protein